MRAEDYRRPSLSNDEESRQRKRLLEHIDKILTGRHEEIISRGLDEAWIRIELLQDELEGIRDCFSAIVCGPDAFDDHCAFYLKHIAITVGETFEHCLLEGQFSLVEQLLSSEILVLEKASDTAPKTKGFNEKLSTHMREAIIAAGTESAFDLIHKTILVTSIAYVAYVIASAPEITPGDENKFDRAAIRRDIRQLLGY